MLKLSENAQAVLNAFTEDSLLNDWKHNHYKIDALAAAFRSVVNCLGEELEFYNEVMISASELLAIATEFESLHESYYEP